MTIREYTLQLLKDTGCNEKSYHRTPVEQAIKDVQWYENEYGKLDFPAEDIGRELVLICNNESLKPYTPPPHLEDFASNGDACKWGLTDLYERNEKILRKAIESGERFDTGWVGCKKEIRSMRICRDDDGMIVECSASMDSALEELDLFTDFLTNEECERLTDDLVEQIRDMLYGGEFVEEITYNDKLPVTATYDEVMKKVEDLEQQCEDTLTESFHECIGATLWVMYPDMPEEEKIDFINERTDAYGRD